MATATAACVRVRRNNVVARRREVDQLDPQRVQGQRDLTILHQYEQGVSMAVLAAIFDLSAPAAYAAASRARGRARAILREEDDGC
jgi:DNA-directed RNA polymerase specialized sigma24 family protein